MEIVYEITATVQPQLCSEYEAFMIERHIPDLIATGSFVSAMLEQSEPGLYRVRYIAPSRESLDRYLDQFAPRLREDFNRHFPSGVEISRAEWSVLKRFA